MQRLIRPAALAAAFAPALWLAGVASAQSTYSARVLPAPFAGSSDVNVQGINNLGQAVGTSRDLDGLAHATLWDAATGAAVELAPLDAALLDSEAVAINDLGQIVGRSRVDDFNRQATLWTASAPSAVTNLGTLPGGGYSSALAINDAGTVAGTGGAAGQHAFTWTAAGGFVDYGSYQSDDFQNFAGFNGINNGGKLVGTAYRLFTPFTAMQASQDAPTLVRLSPEGQFSEGMALAVNDAGTVVGYQNPGSGAPEPAVFNGDGTYTNLGSLGVGEGFAEAINGPGLIVGRVFGQGGDPLDPFGGAPINKAFVVDGGQMYDLLTLLDDPSGWGELLNASGINDSGQIVGSGVYHGEIRGFVLTPVPEPAGLAALALAGLGLVRRRRA